MNVEISGPQTAYPVEVSGWDHNEDFFVEKTELHWSEQSNFQRVHHRDGRFHRHRGFPEQLQHRGGRAGSRDDWRPLSLEEVRKQHIQQVLAMCKGNHLRAAQVLRIGRTSWYRYLKEDGYDQKVIARAKAAAG